MVTVLDDEYMLEMDDVPPFIWLSRSYERIMSCNISTKERKIVHAIGNGLTFAYIIRDIQYERTMELDEYFLDRGDGMHIIISYSGDNEDSINFLRECNGKCIVISTGGRIKKLARERNFEFISLPRGMPSRFVFPEIMGCLYSGYENNKYHELAERISKLYPSSLTEVNEAKSASISLYNRQPVIVYDRNTYGLARKFQEDLLQNSSILAPLISYWQAKMIDGFDKESIAVEFSRSRNRKINNSLLIKVDEGLEGSFYAAVLTSYISIYLAYLYSKEIYLFDKIKE